MSLTNGSSSKVSDQQPLALQQQGQAPPPPQQQRTMSSSPTHGVRNGGGGPGVGKREKAAGSGMSPCAACKLLRRRCAKECVFAPYFPPDEPQKFANVHKVFGASNVNKMLQDLPLHQRSDAVGSMVYEADSRVRDPVYGCVGLVSALQQQVASLQQQLASAQAEIVCLRMHHAAVASNVVSMKGMHQPPPPQQQQQSMGPGGSAAAANSIAASMSAPPPHGHGGHGGHHHHSSQALHGHHSPHHHSGHHHSHMSPHHSPPSAAGPNGMHPQSPELPHQCKPGSGMLMGMDTMDVGQAMWA